MMFNRGIREPFCVVDAIQADISFTVHRRWDQNAASPLVCHVWIIQAQANRGHGGSFGRTIIVLATRALQNGFMHLFPSQMFELVESCRRSESTPSCILSVDRTLINDCLSLAFLSTFSVEAEQGTPLVVAFVRLF